MQWWKLGWVATTPRLRNEAFEVGDWVLLQWEGGRRPTKLSVEWKGPFIVADHDSVREHFKLQDPTDLKIMKPVHATRLRRYKMGLTEQADVNDLVSMDTVEAPVVAIVDHEMFAYEGKRKKLLPRAKWRFLARYEDGEEVWLSWQEADPLAFFFGKHFYRLKATHKTAHDPGPHLSGLQPGYNPFSSRAPLTVPGS